METNSQNRKMAGWYQCRLSLKFQGKKWNHIARDSKWKALKNKNCNYTVINKFNWGEGIKKNFHIWLDFKTYSISL